MNTNQVWIDSHSHISSLLKSEDPLALVELDQTMVQAKQAGIGPIVMGGIDPTEWNLQEKIQKKYPEVWPVFGLHPYFVADQSEEECERAIDDLARRLSKVKALGETGLDFRPHIMKDSKDRQLDFFQAQLELSVFAGKPAVLHVVQAFEEALKMVEHTPGAWGFVHGFNGPISKAEEWVRLGFGISVGAAILKPDNERLRQTVLKISGEFLMVESDDLPPISIISIAEKIAEIRGVTKEIILGKSRDNLLRIFKHAGTDSNPDA